MTQVNLCMKQTHRGREETCGCQGGGVREEMHWEFGISRSKLLYTEWASLVAQQVKNLPAMQETPCNAGDLSSIVGLERSPGEGNGNPLQYACLEKFRGQRSLVKVYKIFSI